jgi:hypothetical protein
MLLTPLVVLTSLNDIFAPLRRWSSLAHDLTATAKVLKAYRCTLFYRNWLRSSS